MQAGLAVPLILKSTLDPTASSQMHLPPIFASHTEYMNSGALVSTTDDAAAQFAAPLWPPRAATLAAFILLLLLNISDWLGVAWPPPSASAAG